MCLAGFIFKGCAREGTPDPLPHLIKEVCVGMLQNLTLNITFVWR